MWLATTNHVTYWVTHSGRSHNGLHDSCKTSHIWGNITWHLAHHMTWPLMVCLCPVCLKALRSPTLCNRFNLLYAVANCAHSPSAPDSSPSSDHSSSSDVDLRRYATQSLAARLTTPKVFRFYNMQFARQWLVMLFVTISTCMAWISSMPITGWLLDKY